MTGAGPDPVTTTAIDLIYEAALVPARWRDALGAMEALSGSASGSIIVFSEKDGPRGIASQDVDDTFQGFLQSDEWKRSVRVQRMIGMKPANFVPIERFVSEEVSRRDPAWQRLRAQGRAHQLCSMAPVASGEIICFTFERMGKEGPYRSRQASALDRLRPHLVRAGLVAARLALAKAQAAVETLERIGLAAAVIAPSGRVIAANALLDTLAPALIPTALGGIAISDSARNAELHEALQSAGRGLWGTRRLSIAIAGSGEHPPLIVHLLPVRGQAQDIFSGGQVLMVVSAIARKPAPQPELLYALFDLSPAEARLAAALTSGVTLAEIAARNAVSISTLRSQLRSILAKTGARRQAELMQLLAGL
jgi:DNA-binding CsgD family transcriptional regulator